ncbi:DUF6687 family protein [Aneurinibacillus sp. REN35]|uniref:DUF6687 family protein n=1 Tax=Aneurinibacillus sp. REN35 TaxID=3237286 RepID=UPI0035282D9A
MISNFYILGSTAKRPASQRTIFTDGAPDATFRPGVDMELSHWIPNDTPTQYKADTSTEICMRFAESNTSKGWDLAINNHLDVDGVLAVFTLVHSQIALTHRQTVIQAAEIGDFSGWGEESAQILFQGLTILMNDLKASGEDTQRIYEACFIRAQELLAGKEIEEPRIQAGLRALHDSINRIASGCIERQELHSRFVHYHIPADLTVVSLAKTVEVPAFNAEVQDNMWLHPQARNRLDREKVHLVSAQVQEGWYYDVWYPGYMWADTPNSWRAPGFAFNGSTNGYRYAYAPLEDAVRTLQAEETADGIWTLAQELSPFSSVAGRNFPIVLSFLTSKNEPVASKLAPDRVASVLAAAFA